jgi:hypothetical protein
MKITLIVLCFNIIACGKVKDWKVDPTEQPKFVGIVEDAKPFVRQFEKEFDVNVQHIAIGFDNIDGPVAGLCRTWSGGMAEITLDKHIWGMMTDLHKLNLIYHELGHCYFYYGHRDKKRTSEWVCPYSFMYRTIISSACIDRYMDDYLKEFIQ